LKKTVLITGCSSGIGKASVRLFAQHGWSVVATMREPQKETELKQIRDVLVTGLDVRKPESIERAVAAGIKRFDRIDVLINNAGYGQYGLFEAIPREKVQEQFDVNVFGVMDVTRALLPHFRKNKAGVIINTSSGAGKFALEGFSEALAYELASQNIAVKIVIPHGGVTATHFSERSAEDRAVDPALSDYDDFVTRTDDAFARMGAARSIGADEVARVIYTAATDGTDRLRYLIGEDSRGFIRARREMSEENYIDFMRSHFRKTS
jgi:NAD(P)-dependent dehydrogenase (short-subunit alcohol dehydrogenase family)